MHPCVIFVFPIIYKKMRRLVSAIPRMLAAEIFSYRTILEVDTGVKSRLGRGRARVTEKSKPPSYVPGKPV